MTLLIECSVIIIPVAIGFFGAAFKFSKNTDEVKSNYFNDVETMKAKIISSKIIPTLLYFYSQIQADQTGNPESPIEEILSRPKYSTIAKDITKATNEIDEINHLYQSMVHTLVVCSKNCLYLGFLTLLWILILALFFNDGALHLISLLLITVDYPLYAICAINVISNFRTHANSKDRFLKKTEQIILGIEWTTERV
jgi:hypothetical protein